MYTLLEIEMKLLTELVLYRITTIPPTNEKRAEGSPTSMSYDAAAAHALMNTLESDYCPYSPQEIIFCADEMMRQWGFDASEPEV
jgi:hypothetical protein